MTGARRTTEIRFAFAGLSHTDPMRASKPGRPMRLSYQDSSVMVGGPSRLSTKKTNPDCQRGTAEVRDGESVQTEAGANNCDCGRASADRRRPEDRKELRREGYGKSGSGSVTKERTEGPRRGGTNPTRCPVRLRRPRRGRLPHPHPGRRVGCRRSALSTLRGRV